MGCLIFLSWFLLQLGYYKLFGINGNRINNPLLLWHISLGNLCGTSQKQVVLRTFSAFEIKVDRKIGCFDPNAKLCSIVLVDSDQLRKKCVNWGVFG